MSPDRRKVCKFVWSQPRDPFQKLLGELMGLRGINVGSWDAEEKWIELLEFSEEKDLHGLERKLLSDTVTECLGKVKHIIRFRTEYVSLRTVWSVVNIQVLWHETNRYRRVKHKTNRR